MLNIFNCTGVVHSTPLNMIHHPALVICLLVGLVFSKPARIGYDASIKNLDAECVKT